MSSEDFIVALDDASKAVLESGFRSHLGASGIGNRCSRAVWYSFRWAYDPDVEGRMLRLWDRGHEEERRVIRWLRAMGCSVRDRAERLVFDNMYMQYAALDWDEPLSDQQDDVHEDDVAVAVAKVAGVELKQWAFADGHYGGSGDGKVLGLHQWFPELAGKGWGLLECKTSNDKYFKELSAKAVQTAKYEHYVQMQVYMSEFNLQWAVYVTVNKNDDHIYVEIIYARPEVAAAYKDRAHQIIAARKAPARIKEDPSWFECKFCDFKGVCHYKEPLAKNCRSCAYAAPGEGQSWTCGLYSNTIPETFTPKGCSKWEPVA